MRLGRRFLFPLLLVGAAILWFVMGLGMYKNAKSFTPATATIVDITYERTGTDDDYTYTTVIEFNVGEKTYKTQLGSYKSSYKVGQELDICYDPENPLTVQPAGTTTAVVFMACSPLLLLLAVVVFFKANR